MGAPLSVDLRLNPSSLSLFAIARTQSASAPFDRPGKSFFGAMVFLRPFSGLPSGFPCPPHSVWSNEKGGT
jgi:hypothetical protein